jgi:two-component system, LytTR family, response regulator
MLSAVIIDAEESAINLLVELLTNHSSIKIVGTAANLTEGAAIIKQTQPDIVFLEVILPGRSGLEIYNIFKPPNFKIIFYTSNQQHVLEILRKSPCGYLLKPVDIIELQKILQKVTYELINEQKQSQMEEMISIQNCPVTSGSNILLEIENGFIIVNTRNIEYCYARNSHSVVVMNSQKEFVVSKSLKELQEVLTEKHFYRPHKSYLMNIYYIQKFVRSKENHIVMESGAKIPVSARVTTFLPNDIKKRITK